MIDVIVYKPSPYGLAFIRYDKILGFIILYHMKHDRVYVSYIEYLYLLLNSLLLHQYDEC